MPEPTPRPATAPGPRTRAAVALGLAALFGVAFAARMVTWPEVVATDEATLFGTDPYYHMRRIRLVAADWPQVPAFESWQNAPTGSVVQWPQGFDFLLGSVVRAVLGPTPDPRAAEHVASAAIPLLGALLALLAYALARRFMTRPWAAVAGLWVALWPGHVHYSLAGRVDHHVIEPLITFGALWLWLRSGDPSRPAGPRRGQARALGWAAMAGATMALAPWMWPSSLLPLGLLAGLMFMDAVWIPPAHGASAAPAARAAVTLGVAAAGSAVVAAYAPVSPSGPFIVHASSWLHPVLLSIAAIGVSGGALIAARWRPTHPVLGPLSAGIAPAVALALAWAVVPGLAEGLAEGAAFLARGGLIATIAESQGLMDQPFERLVKTWTLAYPLVPVFCAALLYHTLHPSLDGARPSARARAGSARMVLATALAALGLLGAIQQRFLVLTALPLGLGVAATLSGAWRAAGDSPLRRWAPIIALTALMVPSVSYYQSVRLRGPRRDAVHAELRWLRDHSPSPGDWLRPDVPPAWSVAGPWALGHEILYVAERPNVACPFITPDHLPGIVRGLDILLAPTVAQGVAAAREAGVRYVLVTPESRETLIQQQALLLNAHAADGTPNRDGALDTPLAETLWARLLLAEGPPGATQVGPLTLVHEADRQAAFLGQPVPVARLWELGPRP